MKTKKSIGILGGMGPDASGELYKIMIEKARTQFSATRNEDYPDIILHSIPVPDFITNKDNVPPALAMLQHSVKGLSPLCSCFGIACNTAHLLLPELQSVTNVPFVSMIDAVSEVTKKAGYKKVGLMATPTTFRSRLYQNSLRESCEVVTPTDDQVAMLGVIVNEVLAGDFSATQAKLSEIAQTLLHQKIDAVILGCTELPLIFPKEFPVPVISSLDTLAEALLTHFYT